MIGDLSQTSPEYKEFSKDLVKLSKQSSLQISPKALKAADRKLIEIKAKISDREFEDLKSLFHDILKIKWKDSLTEKDLTKVYHSLQEKPLSAAEINAEKEKFLQTLNPKTVGHLLGDALLAGMKTQAGNLEGNSPLSSMEFLVSSLEYLLKTYSSQFSANDRENIEKCIARFKTALKFAVPFPRDITLEKGVQLIQELTEQIKIEITSLKENETVLIPWGWSNKDSGGHSMLMEYNPSKGILKVFNTGAGAEIHEADTRFAKEYINTVKTYKISPERFLERLPVLLEPQVISHDSNIMNWNTPFSAKDLYSKLAEYEVESKSIEEVWQKSQLSGTCSLRCCLAYLSSKIGSESYKPLKHLWEKEVISAVLENPQAYEATPEMTKILSAAIPNLFGHLQKSGTSSDLKELERLKALFEASHGERIKIVAGPPPTPANTKLQNIAFVELTVGQGEPAKFDPSLRAVKSLPVQRLTECQNVKELVENLKQRKELFDERGSNNNKAAIQETLCQLGRLLTNPIHAVQKNKFIDELKDQPQLADQCRDLVSSLIQSLYAAKSKNPTDLKHMMAYQSAYLFVFELAKLADSSIANYGVDSAVFLELLNAKSGVPSLLNRELEEDYQYLVAASLPLHQNQQKLNVYTLVPYGAHQFYLKKESGDYRLAEAIAKTKSEAEWKEADKKYQALKQQGMGGDVSKEEYRVAWCYLYLLPRDLQELRRLSFIMKTESIFCVKPHVEPAFNEMKFDNLGMGRDIATFNYLTDNTPLRNPIQQLKADSYAPHVKDITVYLEPYDQNTALIESKGTFYGNHSLHGIHFSEMIDRLRPSLEDLRKQQTQFYVRTTLFHPFKLYEALKDNPALAIDLINFFDEALNYYQFKAVVTMNKGERTQTIAFLTEQKARTLAWMQKVPGMEASAGKHLVLLRNHMQDLLSHPDFQKKDVQQHLALALIESYGSQATLNPNEVSQLLIARSIAAKYPRENTVPKELFDSAAHVMLRHSDSMNKLNDEQWGGLLRQIGKLYQTDFPNNLKIEKRFPLIYGIFPEGVILFDCESGVIKLNGEELLFSEDAFYLSRTYSAVFGGDRFPLRKVVNAFEIEAPDLKISYDSNKKQFTREFQGHLYIYSSSKGSEFFERLPYRGWNQLWISPDKTADPQVLVVNRRTREILHTISNQNEFTLGSKGPKYKLANIKEDEEWKNLIDFDSLAVVWLPVDPTNKPILQLPSNLDESGTPLEFELVGKNDWRWKKHPQYRLNDQFSIQLSLREPFLTIEKSNGEKELIIADPITEKIDRLALKNSSLAPQSSAYKNMLCAYLTLMGAATIQDYEKVLAFLQRSREYRRYNDEELKLLGWIVQSLEENRDHFPDAFSCRLFAASLVYDNFERYPDLTNQKVTESDAQDILQIRKDWTKDKWRLFWKVIVLKKAGESSFLEPTLRHYYKRENNVSRKLRLDLLINEHNLEKWGFETIKSVPHFRDDDELQTNFAPWGLAKLKEIVSKPENFKQGFPLSCTRFQGNSLNKHLPYLIIIAFGTNPQEREKLKDFLLDSRYEKEAGNRLVLTILWAAFVSTEDLSGKDLKWQEFITSVKPLAGSIFKNKEIRWDQYNLSSTADNLTEFSKKLHASLNKLEPAPKLGMRPNRSPPFVVEKAPIKVPDKPAKTDLSYAPKVNLFAMLNKDFNTYFSWPKDANEVIPPRLFEGKDTRIKALNEEYILGYRKNYKENKIELKGSVDEIRQHLLTDLLPELTKTRDSESAKGVDLERLIIEKANQALLQDEKLRIEVGKGIRSYLTLDDCLNLFLQKNTENFKKITGVTSSQEIEILYQMIGNYLEISVKAMVQNELISKIEQLKTDTQPSRETLQEIGKVLATVHRLETSVNPEAVLVFEYKLNLLLRDHQIQGLNELSEPKNRFLQRIQAGGKTLIWGHLLALMKADGYHLSIHVSPTHQYASNLYDMGDRSKYAFSQTQKTLIFDDHPNYFTLEHLEKLEKTLKEAITNREYLHTTNDTLRALRCKYIKTALQTHLHPKMAPSELSELQRKNDILRSILSLLRSRGVFTFDEVHQAMDAQKELNMPYGKVTHPDLKEAKLIHSIVRLAATAKDSDGKSLSQIKENQSPALTFKQKEQLKKDIASKLIAEPQWKSALGVTTPEIEKNLKDYLLDANAELPSTLESKNQERNRLILLAHQMISGGWLDDALSKSVEEHYGVVHKQDLLPIAIPFLANMTPAIGSEFSDTYVMMTNTFISYLVQGISLTQAREFIEFLQSNIIEEYDALKAKSPEATLQDTPIYKNFQALSEKCGFSLNLTTINREDPAQLQKIQRMLSLDDDLSHQVLFNFITTRVISQVELHENQVTTNGRGTATTAKNTNGYSASLENRHIAPVMNAKGDRVAVTQDPGTNGQTIDLLIRKFPSVWVVRPESESLFTDLIQKLPDNQRNRVRAIIDGGCHFRGVSNDKVARMICQKLDNPQIKGVLFFDNRSGKLCFMKKSDPFDVKELKGTSPQVIAEETECSPEELFAYFDQDHGTGTNLALGSDSIAISTIGADNQLHDKLQCDRRMRLLDQYQEIITAIGSESLERVSTLLQKEAVRAYPAGQKVDGTAFIQDIILYLYLNESNREQKLNLQYCLQDMENVVQQYLLDQIYTGKLQEKQVFSEVGDLFIKNVLIDLYDEYAKKKKNIPIDKYLQTIADAYVNKLKILKLPAGEIKQISDTLNAIIKTTVKDMKQTIDVSPEFGKRTKPIAADREATNIQMQQQQKVKEQDEERESQRQNMAKGLSEIKKPHMETPFDPSLLISNTISSLPPSDVTKIKYNKEAVFTTLVQIVNSRNHAEKRSILHHLKDETASSFDGDVLFNAVTLLSDPNDRSKEVEEQLRKNRIERKTAKIEFLGEGTEELSRYFLSMRQDSRLRHLDGFLTRWREIENLMESQRTISYDVLNTHYQDLLIYIRFHLPGYNPPYQPPIPTVFFSVDSVIAEERKSYKGIFETGLLATSNFIRTSGNDFSNVLDNIRKSAQQVLLICDTNPKTKSQEWKSVLVTHNEAKLIAEQMKGMKLPPNRRMWLVRPQGELAWPGAFPYDINEIRSNPQAMRQLIQTLYYSGNVYFLSRTPWFEAFKEWIESFEPNKQKTMRDFFEKEILRGPMLEKYFATALPKLWDTAPAKPFESEGLLGGVLRFFKGTRGKV